MVGSVGIEGRTAAGCDNAFGVDVLDISKITGAVELLSGGLGVFFSGKRFFRCQVTAVAAQPGKGEFDTLSDHVDIVEIGSFRDVHVEIDTLGIDFREEFHRFFQADDQQPGFEQQDEHAEGGGDNRQRHVQGRGENARIALQYRSLDLDGLLHGP